MELQKGENRLLVEVDNWEGNWRLILRLEDENGEKLLLNDEGELIVDEAKEKIIHSLLLGPWVRKWRFSPIMKDWKDKRTFPQLSEEDIKFITFTTLSQSLTEISPSDAFVDFRKYYAQFSKTTDVAGYVLREILCEEPTKVKIYTGSDDSIRIWLNGMLIKRVLALREAKKDQDSCTGWLKKGKNLLPIEVANGGGDWGLFFRLEDENGNDLFLSDEGKLERW